VSGATPAVTWRRHPLPVVTVVLMAASLGLVLVVPFLGELGGAFVGDSALGVGGLVLLTANALGLLGGIAAFLHRSLPWSARISWAIVSASSSFFLAAGLWMLLVLLFGP